MELDERDEKIAEAMATISAYGDVQVVALLLGTWKSLIEAGLLPDGEAKRITEFARAQIPEGQTTGIIDRVLAIFPGTLQ